MKKLTFLILFAASAVFSAKADLTFTIDLEDWSDVGSNLYVSVAYNTSGTWQGWKDRTQATYLGGNCYSYTISESGTISGWQAQLWTAVSGGTLIVEIGWQGNNNNNVAFKKTGNSTSICADCCQGTTPTVTLTAPASVSIDSDITFSAEAFNFTDAVITYYVKLPNAADYQAAAITSPYTPETSGNYAIKAVAVESSDAGITAFAEKTVNVVVPITVKVKAGSSTWTNPIGIYYWGGASSNSPVEMTAEIIDCETWYTKTFDISVTSVNIIFVNGSSWSINNNQTGDITTVTSSTAFEILYELDSTGKRKTSNVSMPAQTIPLFQVTGDFNNWFLEDLVESDIAGVWKYTTTLAAGDYQFKIRHRNSSCYFDWPDWWANNRIFTLDTETEVTFYAREETCKTGNVWVFYCDAQDLYLTGSNISTEYHSTENPLIKENGSAYIYVATPNTSNGNCQIRVQEAGGTNLVNDDIMQCAKDIDAGKIYKIEFCYATMSVVTTVVLEFEAVYVKHEDLEKTAADFNNTDFEEVTTLPIGGKVLTSLAGNEEDVFVQMGYKFDNNNDKSGYITLDWDSNTEDNSIFLNQTAFDVLSLSGLSLTQGDHTLKIWYKVTINGISIYESNNGSDYIASFSIGNDINNPTTSLDNPTANRLTVFSQNNSIFISASEKINSVALYNIAGQTVTTNSSVSSLSYNINNLNSGIYILKIITKNNTYSQKVVVK